MEEQQISILEALENQNIFVSVRKNRLYNKISSNKSSFKLVLAITAENNEVQEIIGNIKSRVVQYDVEIVENKDKTISHLFLYCKDAETVKEILEFSINGHTLRSNTRYTTVKKTELAAKAEKLANLL